MTKKVMSHFNMKEQRSKHAFATTFSTFRLLNIFFCVLCTVLHAHIMPIINLFYFWKMERL
jgi:hypothetical protein